MKAEELTALSDQELLKEAKTARSTNIMDAVIIGVLIGIALYSTVKNGFGLLTFLPLIYLPVAARNKVKRDAVGKIVKERNLS